MAVDGAADDEIAKWLGDLGMDKYAGAFHAQDVDLRALPHLTETDLQQLGVTLGHRRILLAAIARLTNATSTPETAATPPAEATHEQAERRLVSVLFCDMVSSTELSRRLDPEDLRQLLRNYQDRVAGAVARYGGHLAQYLGDGVMAYFGWPTAYEDQAERAVRAGLEAIAAIRSLETGAVGAIRSRIAIATGKVVVGDLSSAGRQEGAIAGETPNFAARLQHCAGPDELVISDTTRELIGEAFEISDRGSVALKDFGDAVPLWRVDAVRDVESRFDARHGQSLSPIVGRRNELALVQEKWELAKAGEGQVVLVSGEAGIGKSRFVRAIADAVGREQHGRWQLQCSPYHTSSALFPVIQSLNRALGLTTSDTPAARLAKLEAMLHDTVVDVRRTLPIFAELLSLPIENGGAEPALSPQEKKILTLGSLVERCVTMAQQAPLLLVVEDAHWIDPTTLELIEQTVARIADARVLMLVLYRPDWGADWASHYGHITALSLGRLPRPQVAELVRNLMGGGTDDAVIGEIAARTDGVPMFVEEVARVLVEAEARKDLDTLQVPATLQGALVARLDGLPASSKEVVQAAAVMGREFHPDVIANVCRRARAEIDKALDDLVRARLVIRAGPSADSLTFRHALIQDVAYQSLLRSNRRRLHQAVADALAAIRPETAGTQPELLAHHLTEAGLPGRALGMWRRACERAMARFANDEAVRHAERALETAGQLQDIQERGRETLASHILLGDAQQFASRLPEAMATFQRVAAMARLSGNADALVEAALGFDQAEFSTSELRLTAVTLLREALQSIGEEPDSRQRCHLMGKLTRAYIMTGERALAEDYGRRTAAMARRLGDDRELAEVLVHDFLIPKPGYDPAELAKIGAELDEFLATAARVDNYDLYARAVASCFYRWLEYGERGRVEAILRQWIDWAEGRQYTLSRWLLRHAQAMLATMDGDLARSEAIAEQGLELGNRCQGDQAEGIYGMQMFTVRREQGRLAEVAPIIRRLIDDRQEGSVWRPGFALIASELGYHPAAQRMLDELAENEFVPSHDAKRSTTLAYLAEVCTAVGDSKRAPALYDLLTPYTNMSITAGIATMCYGSARRYLGQLADTLDSWELAEEHFEKALTFNEDLRAPLWVAHTQADFSRMLRRRGRPADAARADALHEAAWMAASRLGLKALTDKLRRLQN